MTSDCPPHQVTGSSRGAQACPSCRTSPRSSHTNSHRTIGSSSWPAMGCGMWSMTRRLSRLHAPRREGAAWCIPLPPEGTSTATAARSRRRARSCARRWIAARWTTSPSSSHGYFGLTTRPPAERWAERRLPQRAQAHREGRAASSGATECADRAPWWALACEERRNALSAPELRYRLPDEPRTLKMRAQLHPSLGAPGLSKWTCGALLGILGDR